jgi:glycosyltransferase involved in cell wall biosynthesis
MFGLVFLEAMAAGLPIISINKPYIREIIRDGEAGILVEREQRSIENAILRLLGDSALRRRLGTNGRQIVEQKYRLDKVIQQYWNLYKFLLYQ